MASTLRSCAALLCWSIITQAQQTLFPGSIPLSVRSPYLNVWYKGIANDAPLSNAWAFPWLLSYSSGWSGLIRVDNLTYPWLGHNVGPYTATSNVTDIQITPTRSIFLMQAGPVSLNVTFLSPIEPSDWIKQSLPFSYLAVDIQSLDGQAHSVQMFSDFTAEWVSGERDSTPMYVTWTQPETPSSFYYEIVLQDPKQYQESQSQAEDGKAYYATATRDYALTWQIAQNTAVIQQFYNNGALTNSTNVTFTDPVNQPWYSFSTAVDLGSITSTGDVPVLYAIGYIRDPSVQFTDASGEPANRRPYFVTEYADGTNTSDVVEDFISDFPNACSRSVALDTRITTDAEKISSEYVDLVSLGARQAFGALDITTSSTGDPSDILIFMKDIGTSHRVNPVERIYAAFPSYLYLNASLCGAMLKPLLITQDQQYEQTYAAYDLGNVYPIASGQRQDPSQGIEQTGNMLIMMYAYARFSGDGSLLVDHYNLTKRWADYLVNRTLTFSDQVSADGETNANMTNLAIKGIIGVKAMAEIARALGVDDDADQYDNATSTLAASWQSLAQSSTSSHLLGLYGEQQSWALMYNIYADKLLGTNLIPQSILDGQTSFYNDLISSNPTGSTFGLPIDSALSPNASASWMMFTAGTVTNDGVRDLFISSVWSRVSSNTTSGPFVNEYDYQSGETSNGTASPALGAVFSLLALNLTNMTITSNVSVPNSPTASDNSPSSSAPIGAIVGGVVGGVVVITIAVASVWFWCKRLRQRASEPSHHKETDMIQIIYQPSPFPYDQAQASDTLSTPSVFQVNSPVSPKSQQRVPDTPETEETWLSNGAERSQRDYTDATSIMTPSEVIGLRAEVESLRQVMQRMRTERLEPPPQYHSDYRGYV